MGGFSTLAPNSWFSASPAMSIMGGTSPSSTALGTSTALGPSVGQQGGTAGVGAPGSASTNPILDILTGMSPQQAQGGAQTPSPSLAAIVQALQSSGGGFA